MKILISDIARAIHEPDEILNAVIEAYLEGQNDIATWRLDNYSELRRWAYPPFGDSVDAILTGGTELANLKQICLDVKVRFPKP